MTRTAHIASRQAKALAAVRSRATKAATTLGLRQPESHPKIGEVMAPTKKPRTGPEHDTMFEFLVGIDWLLAEIDDRAIAASPIQRAAIVSARKYAQAVYELNW